MIGTLKSSVERIIPEPVLSAYHFVFAHIAALMFGYPSRKLLVIAVTGTKGKTSVTEMINAILEEAGHKTALMNSIRFKVADESTRNLTRMSMPGRFFIQRFMHEALRAGCSAVVLEMTSEGAWQHRHRAIDLDALVFTNLAPEHIERHGSYEKYADAKFEIGKQLVRSKKRPRIIVTHTDDSEGKRYLTLGVEKIAGFSLHDHQPYEASERGGHFNFLGIDIEIHLPGEFSLKNALGAAKLAEALGIESGIISRALAKIKKIPGRGETINEGQNFTVVVDYAHTPDSLQALYNAYGSSRKICILGNTGGGRDTWKRPVMGEIADRQCAELILTNEDPYDEDPLTIVEQMAAGMSAQGGSLPDGRQVPGGKSPKLTIIMDRREAIREALQRAKASDAVLITGKGTDPNMCVANGKKIPWDDAEVVREELHALADTSAPGPRLS